MDVSDLLIVALSFGESPGRPRWNPKADLNNDGIIDISDILETALNFGWTTDP